MNIHETIAEMQPGRDLDEGIAQFLRWLTFWRKKAKRLACVSPMHKHVYHVSGLAALGKSFKQRDALYVGRCDCGETDTLWGCNWRSVARGEWDHFPKDQVVFDSLRLSRGALASVERSL